VLLKNVNIHTCSWRQRSAKLPFQKKGGIKMQIKFIAMGVGAAIPKSDLGVNALSGVYIQIRSTPQAKSYVFGIAKGPEIGGKNGTLVASYVNTKWIDLDGKNYSWLCDHTSLVGKLAQLEIAGTLLLSGKVDVSFTVYDKTNEEKFSMSKIDIESSGGQISTTSVRGKIVDMMKNAKGRSLCDV
jgi:hypothetical protein